MRVRSIFLYLLALTAPIERLFVLEVAGYSLRPVYVVMVVLATYYLLVSRVRIKLAYLMMAILYSAYCVVNTMTSIHQPVTLINGVLAIMTAPTATVFLSAFLQYKEDYELMVRAYVRAAVFWSLVAVIQWFAAFVVPAYAYSYLGPFPRIHALTFEPSFLATYLIFPLFLSMYGERREPLLAIIILAAVASTLSRTGVLAVFIGFLGIVLKSSVKFRPKKVVLYVTAFILAGFFSFAVPPVKFYISTITSFVADGVTLRDTTSARPRLQSWVDAYNIFTRHPLVGVGLGAYGFALNEYKAGSAPRKPIKDIKTTNLFLEVLAEQGVVGGAFFLIWWALPVIVALRSHRLCLLGPVYAYAVLGFTFLFTQTWWRPYIWLPWIISLTYAYRRR